MRSRSRSGTLASRLRTRCTAQCWRSEAGQHRSMAVISPGAPSATISSGGPSPRTIRSRASSSQSSCDSRIPSITESSTRSPCSVNPQAKHALLGPVGADGEEDRVEEERRQLDVVEVAAPKLLEALAQLLTDARRGRLRELPEPGPLAERLDVAHRQAADEGADHQRPQWVGAKHLGSARGTASRRTARRPRGPAGFRAEARPPASAACGAKAVAQ